MGAMSELPWRAPACTCESATRCPHYPPQVVAALAAVHGRTLHSLHQPCLLGCANILFAAYLLTHLLQSRPSPRW